MYYQEAEHIGHDRMGFAVFVALALHLLLVLGLSFEPHDPPNFDRQLKVTLATQPAESEPDDAQHIAQNNQVGSAEEAQRHQASSPRPTPRSDSMSRLAQERQSEATRPNDREVPLLATNARAETQVDKRSTEQESLSPRLTGINPEVDRLEEELANLEATLENQTKALADRPRVRRLSSVSTKRAVDAAYLNDWRARLEAVGNKYYPEASLRYGIYGKLQLLVVVRQDGSLENLEVLSSSGYAVLDEAAMKIVRLAAPFAPFPAELRSTTDKLEIIRTWQFQENRLSSG